MDQTSNSLFLALVLYFFAQIVVATKIKGFNPLKNTISRLGNTELSPWAGLMNFVFVLTGITTILGCIFRIVDYKDSTVTKVGFGIMAVASIGSILVGLNPENANKRLHYIGALLSFILGNVSLIVIATQMYPELFGTAGAVGLLGLAFLPLADKWEYFGGLERITSSPQTICLIIYGIIGLAK